MSGEFEDLVRDSMSWFAADVQVPPQLVSRARQRLRRRRLAARAAVAAATAAVSAAAVIVVTAGAGGVRPGPGGPAPTGPAQVSAYVLRRAEKAVRTQRLIFEVITPQQVMTTQRRGKPPLKSFIPRELVRTYQGWERDEVFATYLRGHGRPRAAHVDTGSGPPRWTEGTLSPFTETIVNYSSRTWYRGTQLVGRGATSYPGTACDLVRSMWDPLGAGELFFRSPSFVASALACGGFSVAGHVQVDGTAAIKLTGTPRLNVVPITVYISPSTYLLIRTMIGGLRQDYRWLAPTRANRALLTVPIPAGFRRTADSSEPQQCYTPGSC